MMSNWSGNAARALAGFWMIACAVVHATRADEASAPAASRPAEVSFECRWADMPIEIDGKADEAVWATAQPIEDFRRAWEGKKERPPKTTTKAKLLWDREYL